jgi:hypothetical protein
MSVIGQDCHVKLSHTAVSGGEPAGFLVDTRHKLIPEGVRINREVISDGTTAVWVYFDVVLADHLLNPDGSPHVETRSQMYSRLLQYLAQTAGIELETLVGTLTNLGALGFTADERHTPGQSIIKVQLNNVGYYWPPVNPELLALSIWNGTLTWGSAYWR